MWRKLVFGSLRYHARSHFGSLLGVIVASAVLVGALAVGDCVRGSLHELALERIGKTSFALVGGDRLFRAQLADDLRPGITNGAAASILQLPGTAANADGSARANHVSLLGVDSQFWAMAQTPPQLPPSFPNGVALNQALARQLGAKVGDSILLHAQKPSATSLDAPLSPQEEVQTGFRLPVAAIVSDEEFGRFGLQANQAAPFNAFLPLDVLQSNVAVEGKANLLLVGGSQNEQELAMLLREHWTLADADAQTRQTPGGIEIGTERVFLDPPMVEAAVAVGQRPQELISTYFVNEIRHGKQATPYSMVTGASPPLVPGEMRDDEILANQWLADDLQLKPGDEIDLTYLVPGASQRLEEKHGAFRLRGILPMDGPTADRTLMPDFPGIAKAEKTENWDAGYPIDLRKIRPKDETYWKNYRGTPKAFVTLNAARRLWGNRFGDLTAIRFAATVGFGGGNSGVEKVEREISSRLDPASLGLSFRPVRQQALAASSQAEDFGGLFIGFSFFLIVAALILLALLFQLGLERRSTEIGTLLALGWRPRQVRRWLLAEGAAIAALGGVIGTFLGLAYARAILYGLSTVWREAVNTSMLHFFVTTDTLFMGCLASVLVSAGVIWLALRGQTKRPARELLELGHEMETHGGSGKSRRRYAGIVAILSALGALAMIGSSVGKHDSSAVEGFFGGSSLLLIAGIAAAAVWFRQLARRSRAGALTLASLGLRTTSRQPKRSLAVVALLASGSFLIIAIQAYKLDANQDSALRASGAGGFALMGESALPVTQNLNDKAGLAFFGLEAAALPGVEFVPMRVREGDDASCLNLNRAQTPRLLGVDPQLLAQRHSFTFTELADKSFASKPWELLKAGASNATSTVAASAPSPTPPAAALPDEIPAIGDEASITWALGKKIGDTIDYTDERGRKFKVRLVGAMANSILQGSLIIDQAQFVQRFPGTSGYKMFLIDCPSTNSSAVATTLGRALQDRGMEIARAADRLNALNAVQNTYLDTFEVLGGLGLLLGSAGLGVVVLRNVLERRGELAVLQALGFRRNLLRWLIISEHGALECLGLLLGVIAAMVAVLPSLLSSGARVSIGPLAGMLALVFLSGLVWTWIAARVALRGELLDALRNE